MAKNHPPNFRPVIDASDQAVETMVEQLAVREWQRALRYMIRKLDAEAERNGKGTEYHAMLFQLKEDIASRIAMGYW